MLYCIYKMRKSHLNIIDTNIQKVSTYYNKTKEEDEEPL